MSGYRAIKVHFLNSLIWRGRKLVAENFFVRLLWDLKLMSGVHSFDVFYYSMLNLRPLVFLRPVKAGSTFYKTPAPITDHKRRLYAIKFLVQSARDSRGLINVDRVSNLLFAIYSANKNLALDRKFALYNEALENRSFIRKLKYL